MIDIGLQIAYLFILAIPIACVAWTITHEEILREPREYCTERSQNSSSIFVRKLFYMLTCEYCFSHYVTLFFLFITEFTLLFDDWRGYLISFFSLVWIANIYMSIFGRIRLTLKKERVEIKEKEEEIKEKELNGRHAA
jgi:hypothetical protein